MILIDSTTDLDALLPVAPLSAAAQRVVASIRYDWERDLLARLAGMERVATLSDGSPMFRGLRLKPWQRRRVESWGILGETIVERDANWPAQDAFAAPVVFRGREITELGQEICAEFADDGD